MKLFHVTTKFLQKNPFFGFVAVGLFFALATQQSSAQTTLNVWSIRGLSQQAYRVVVDPKSPNIVYANGTGGVFKSTDYGESWGTTTIDPALGAGVLTINPIRSNTLYLGTHSGVYKTVNGAATWFRTNSPDFRAGSLTVAPSQPSIIYAATGYDGTLTPNPTMLISTDGGETWNSRPFPVQNMWIWCLEVDSHDPMLLYAFLGSWDDGALLKSNDGGISWTPFTYAGHITPTLTFRIDPLNSNIIYAATYEGVYKSSDAGINWTLRTLSAGQEPTAIAIDPANPQILYVGAVTSGCCYTGVYKSTDGGATWNTFNTGLSNFDIRQLTFDRSGLFLYAATAEGVYRVRVRRGVWVVTSQEN